MKYKQFFKINNIVGTPYYTDGIIVFHKAWKGFPPKRGLDVSDFGEIKDEKISKCIIAIADAISDASPVIFLGKVCVKDCGVGVFAPDIFSESNEWAFVYDVYLPPVNSIGKKYRPFYLKSFICNNNMKICYFKDRAQPNIPFAFYVVCLNVSDAIRKKIEEKIYD